MSRAVRWIALLLPPAALFLAAAFREHAGPVNHVDETAWVANAYYGELAFAGDLHNPDWQLLPARDSPPIGKYAFAIALRAIGRPVRSIGPLASWYARYEAIPGAWGKGEARDRRQAIARRFDRTRDLRAIGADHVRACRRVALVAGMLAAIGLGSIGLAMRGPATGLLAGLAFSLHPITVTASMLAMFDTMAVMWSIMSVRLLMGLVGSTGWKRAATSVGLGLSMVMAVGTKMNALIVVALTVLAMSVLLGKALVRKDSRSLKSAALLACSLVIGLVVFVGTNPALGPNVVEGLADLFQLPAETTRVQAGFLPDFLGLPIARGVALGQLLLGFREGLLPIVAVVAIATAGTIRDRSRWVALAWAWLALAMVTAWLPFPWPRYALPVVPCVCLIAADSLISIAGMIPRFRPSPSQPDGGSATMAAR